MKIILSIFTSLAFVNGTALSQDFSYPDFSTGAGLTLKNSAEIVGTELRLTPAVDFAAGSAWRGTKTLVAHGFDTTFTFKIGGGDGADGFAFAIHNDPQGLSAIGGIGGGLGYSDLLSGLVVEFDTFQNPADPPQNHVAALSRGVRVISSDQNYSVLGTALHIPPFSLEDNQYHIARVRYVPGTLEIYVGQFTLPSQPSITYSVNLTNIGGNSVLDSEGRAYLGFTASTGADNDNHYIGSWSFLSTPAPTNGDPVTATISSSVCLEWLGALGDRYQILTSQDLSIWTPLGLTFIGTGQQVQHFEKITETQKFFKVIKVQ